MPWGNQRNRFYWTVNGPEGAIAFVAGPSGIPTGINELFDEKTVDGIPWIGWDLGGHSYTRLNEYDHYNEECPALLRHESCYFNGGTALGADELLKVWLDRDLNDEFIYQRLESLYGSWLREEE